MLSAAALAKALSRQRYQKRSRVLLFNKHSDVATVIQQPWPQNSDPEVVQSLASEKLHHSACIGGISVHFNLHCNLWHHQVIAEHSLSEPEHGMCDSPPHLSQMVRAAVAEGRG